MSSVTLLAEVSSTCLRQRHDTVQWWAAKAAARTKYKLYGFHWLIAILPSTFVVLVRTAPGLLGPAPFPSNAVYVNSE